MSFVRLLVWLSSLTKSAWSPQYIFQAWCHRAGFDVIVKNVDVKIPLFNLSWSMYYLTQQKTNTKNAWFFSSVASIANECRLAKMCTIASCSSAKFIAYDAHQLLSILADADTIFCLFWFNYRARWRLESAGVVTVLTLLLWSWHRQHL